jgi:hypothetical protein
MQVTNEIIVLNYSAGVLSYSVGIQKGVTTNPNLALWEDLDEEKLLFVHSTSWRFEEGLIITWLALPKEQCVLDRIYVESPIVGSESATRPGGVHVSKQNVVAHGLWHLALLVTEDTVVRAALPADFAAYLATLVPAAARGF